MASMMSAYMASDNGFDRPGRVSPPETDRPPREGGKLKFQFSPVNGSRSLDALARPTPDVAPVAAARRVDASREAEEKKKDDPRPEPTLRVKLVPPGRDVPPETHLWTDANDDDEELQRSCFVLLFGATPRSAGGAALVCSSDDAALDEAAIDADAPKDFRGCPSLVCADGDDAAAGAPDDLEEPESAFALARRSSDSVRKYMCAEDADSAARDPCGNELPWDEDESDDGVPLTE